MDVCKPLRAGHVPVLRAGGQEEKGGAGREPGRGLHSSTSEPNLSTFGNTSLTLELNLSTFGTHSRGNLLYIGDNVSLS